MGADGHVKIYDLEQLKKYIQEPYGYRYTLLGREVLVSYWDDVNYDGICIQCGEYGGHKDYVNHERFIEQIEKESGVLLANWEVWT